MPGKRSHNPIEIAREYFPDVDGDYIDHLIWDETGYPCFWNIPRDGDTPQDCFRMQISRAAARDNFAEFGYFDGEKSINLAFAEQKKKEAPNAETSGS